MAGFPGKILIGVVGLGVATYGLQAQQAELRRPVQPVQEVPGPAATMDAELHRMSSESGVIFTGQVVAVRQPEDAGSGWVEVEFRVEEAIRGCVNDGIYRLREWAGLWAGGLQRYRVGQELLMFLHAPSASGLSSPVAGQDGAILISGSGPAPGPRDGYGDAGERTVDLRWIEARILRSAAGMPRFHVRPLSRTEPVLVGRERAPLITRKADMPRLVSDRREIDLVSADASGMESSLAQTNGGTRGISLRSVVTMLSAWEGQQADAAR